MSLEEIIITFNENKQDPKTKNMFANILMIIKIKKMDQKELKSVTLIIFRDL